MDPVSFSHFHIFFDKKTEVAHIPAYDLENTQELSLLCDSWNQFPVVTTSPWSPNKK